MVPCLEKYNLLILLKLSNEKRSAYLHIFIDPTHLNAWSLRLYFWFICLELTRSKSLLMCYEWGLKSFLNYLKLPYSINHINILWTKNRLHLNFFLKKKKQFFRTPSYSIAHVLYLLRAHHQKKLLNNLHHSQQRWHPSDKYFFWDLKSKQVEKFFFFAGG